MIRIIENNINDDLSDNFEIAVEEFQYNLQVIDDIFKIFMNIIERIDKEDTNNDLKELIFPDVKLNDSNFSKNMIQNLLSKNPTDDDYKKATDKINNLNKTIEQYMTELNRIL